MFELFTDDPRIRYGERISPIYHQVADRIRDEINGAVRYHRNRLDRVHNDHLLVRLLNQMPPPASSGTRAWYYNGEDLVSTLDQPFGILSDTNGIFKSHNGVFFSGSIAEIIFDFRAEVNLDLPGRDILDISAIKVISHPYSQISYFPLNGHLKAVATNGDYSVIGVDIALLYTQYHIWLAGRTTDADDELTIHNFISNYPLTSAIRSYIDQAILNRAINSANGVPLDGTKYTVPHTSSRYVEQLDAVLETQLRLLKTQPCSYPETLTVIPAVYHANQLLNQRLPEVMLNRPMRWVMLLARLSTFNLLASGIVKVGTGNDNAYRNKWRSGLATVKSDRGANFPSTVGIETAIKKLADSLNDT